MLLDRRAKQGRGQRSSARRRTTRLWLVIAAVLGIAASLALAAHDENHFDHVVVVTPAADGFETGWAYYFPDDFFYQLIHPSLPIILDRIPSPGEGPGTMPQLPPEPEPEPDPEADCDQALLDFWKAIGLINTFQELAIYVAEDRQLFDENGQPNANFDTMFTLLEFTLKDRARASIIYVEMEAMDCEHMPSMPL